MPIPDTVSRLIDRFQQNFEEYVSRGYKETPVRRDFIDPLFQALGWDVANTAGLPETTREVLHEYSIKIGRVLKAPDYCFRTGRERKFFVEAKRPFEDIKNNPEWAFQLRRYGWSARVPLSILTDFEEFAIYDCRFRPSKADSAATARIAMFRFSELPEKWDEFSNVFSRAAVLSGAFDSYADTQTTKRGTLTVDDAFLQEMEAWRDALARNIALRNRLSVSELNFSVQQIIDRIVFLRISEDRGIETEPVNEFETPGVLSLLSNVL